MTKVLKNNYMAAKKINKLKNSHPLRNLSALIVVLAIAIFGYHLLSTGHAQTPFSSTYAANGAMTYPAILINGGSNAGDQAAQFGTALTTPPPTSTEAGCTYNGVVAPCTSSVSGTGASGWGTPVFDDEFTQDKTLNTSVWTPYWYANGQTQNGTTMEESNVSLSGGYLNLETAATDKGSIINGSTYDGVSGHKGFSFTYGFAESRMYLPSSGGQVANWPAWWLSDSDDGGSYAPYGEIDIMEGLGGGAAWHVHGVDSDTPCGGNPSGSFNSGGWHTFAVDWQAGTATFYYDGVDVGTCNSSVLTYPNSGPMIPIVENSIGDYGGPTLTPADMQVSYVRIWQN